MHRFKTASQQGSRQIIVVLLLPTAERACLLFCSCSQLLWVRFHTDIMDTFHAFEVELDLLTTKRLSA